MAGISEMIAGMAKGGNKPRIADRAPKMQDGEDGGEHSQLHDHGDGTFHTVTSDGERMEHPHLHHALVHLAAHHDGGARHFMVHHDGSNIKSHEHGGEGGAPEAHDHDNIEALKDDMGKFFNEEEHEGGHKGGEDETWG